MVQRDTQTSCPRRTTQRRKEKVILSIKKFGNNLQLRISQNILLYKLCDIPIFRRRYELNPFKCA